MLRIILIFCSVLVVSAAAPVFSAPVGTVTKFSGDVSFKAKGADSYQPLTRSMALSEGAWLKTGRNGWLELDLIDKSRFRLANNSELELERFLLDSARKEGLFTLTQGKLRASVAKSPGLTSSLKVRNKAVVAGVKGTEFLMLSEGPANVFFGNEGVVAISGHDGRETSLLPQFMTQTTRGFTPIEPVAVEPDTPIAKARAAFEDATGSVPPDDWVASNNLPEIIARWNISYGHYLADSGKYDQALKVFQIALDLAKGADILCDARLERSAVYSRFLGKLDAALAENLAILKDYPQALQAESALFNAGQIYFELSDKEHARERFTEYLRMYPNGRHRNNVETLLGILSK